MLKLTHFRLCPFSRAVRLLLAELRLEPALREERPWEWRAELLALNPAGELPVLETGSGAAICGSYAISEYLGEAERSDDDGAPNMHPFPGSAMARAEVRRLVGWFLGKMQEEVTRHLIEQKVVDRLRGEGGRGPDVDVLRAARENLRHHLAYLDHLAAERRWLAGDDLSYADLAAAAQLSCVDYLGEADWQEREAARLWYARMKSRPSLRAILAERLPGAPTPPPHYADPDF